MALSSSSSGESRFYPRESLKDLRSVVFWRDVVCETLATTLLITFLMLVVTGNNAHYVLTTTHIGFFAVIAVYLLLEGYGPFSSQMNPAVSLTLFLAGRISLARGISIGLHCTAQRIIVVHTGTKMVKYAWKFANACL